MIPSSVCVMSGSTPSTVNTAASSTPALVMTAPVTETPTTTASRCRVPHLLAHPRDEEDVVVDAQGHEEQERQQRHPGVEPRVAEHLRRQPVPAPSAAKKLATTVATSTSGPTTARSSTTSTARTTRSTSGATTRRSRSVAVLHVEVARGAAAHQRPTRHRVDGRAQAVRRRRWPRGCPGQRRAQPSPR